jgi:hypothetical protein
MNDGQVDRTGEVISYANKKGRWSMVGSIGLAMSCKINFQRKSSMVDGRIDEIGRVFRASKGNCRSSMELRSTV